MRVIVTDADDKKALAAVRSLGRKGFHVCAAGAKRWDQSFFSKYCAEALIYPNPVKDPEGFVSFLLGHLGAHRYDCVLPMSDYTTILLSRSKDEFAKHTNLAVADHDVLSLVRDKVRILEIARRLGIAAPETWCPANLDEVRRLAPRLPYPCVIKYRRGTGSLGMRHARTPAELLARYQVGEHAEDIVFDDTFPIIQEYIPGEIRDVSLLFNRGRPRAALTVRRVKTVPPTGGSSAVVETTRDGKLIEEAVRLLGEVGWHGPAQVEFKMDSRDGAAKLMEVNTRFWGDLGASTAAGIDFAYLTCRLAVDGDVEPAWDYRVGLSHRWPFARELPRIRQCEDKLDAVLDWLTFKRGAGYDIRPSDPLPHLVKAGLTLYRHARKLTGGIGTRRV